MKSFSKWLESKKIDEGVLDSKWAKAGAGAFLGGPIGAQIGYAMGDAKSKSSSSAAPSGMMRRSGGQKGHSDDAKQDHEELRRRGTIEGDVVEDKVNGRGERQITYKLPNGVRMTKHLGKV
jgi:hypothetical protein